MYLAEIKDKLFNESLSSLPEGKILISAMNAYSFCILQKDESFKHAIRSSNYVLSDGISIVWAMKFLTGTKIKKIAGADLFEWEMTKLQQRKGKCFFLGSCDHTLKKIHERAREKYPDVTIRSYSPPFKHEFSSEENEVMIREINEFAPDVLFIGMTAPKQEKWGAIHINNLNTIMNTAYNGISISNHSAPHSVKNNFIRFCCPWPELDDGGGIYTYYYTNNVVRTIEGNIVLDVGHNTGVNNSSGIYLDETSKGVQVKNNTVANCGIGIHIHKGSTNTFDGNNVFNNFSQIQFSNWTYTPLIYGNVLNNNVFMAKSATQRALAFYTTYNEIAGFATAQNNYYARPIDDIATFFIYPSTNETLSQWKTRVSPQDGTSMKSNLTTTDTTGFFILVYNASKAARVIPLGRPMMDVRGNKYPTGITLQPYASAILMKDPSSPKANAPVLTGAIITNATPSVIQMTFDMTLASVNPGGAAFTAMVNGVRRTINSVSISGTKVLLTMSAPAMYGDAVTIAYTKPAQNPLQASTGEQADSFTAQSVTNGINSPPVPVINSAAVENDTPDKIEITYNLELRNVAPPTTAFSVKINSAPVSVSSVSISGSVITLRLPVRISSRDYVTFSYSKPSANPVQTLSNGQASDVTDKPVVNNVISLPTGENESYEGSFSIYPNPAGRFVYVSSTESSDVPQIIRIYDFAGRLCQETRVGSYSGRIQIPVDLRSGIYFLHVHMKNNRLFTYKLVIR